MSFSDREQLRGMDFEKMSLEELARAKAAIARLRLPVQDVPTRRFAPDRRGARADLRATLRAALRSGGLIELKRRSRAPPPAAARRAVRHLRLDEPLQPHLSAFHALGHQRPRPGPYLRLRDAADQHHPLSAPSRCRSGARPGRRGGDGLVGRDPHRPCARRVQPAVVAPPAGSGRDRAVDHRRARPRRRRRARARDGPAAPLVPPADLAEPAVALRGFRAKISRDEGDDAVCRRVPPGAQSREPRDFDRGAERAARRGAATAAMASASQRGQHELVLRHPRESGGPGQPLQPGALGSRFRGNDGKERAA